ncbi:hypothetical protein OHAE_3656 [Ochrobactrum soli]|uniref:Uncharacterized protein n=1 Tax=Ochrobactrum soli TaxID=2448455 RepID=A0A2P9HHZ3_9HYPH|nr:hypothetical protein OHAE_3656 [[Ochrobactrum] soli]
MLLLRREGPDAAHTVCPAISASLATRRHYAAQLHPSAGVNTRWCLHGEVREMAPLNLTLAKLPDMML